MIIKWETGGYGRDLIRRIECTRETEKSVWHIRYGKETRRDKVSSYERVHDSWEEAKAFLVEKTTQSESTLEDQLHRTRERLSILCRLEKPEEAK